MTDPTSVIRTCFEAFSRGDRAAMEAVIAKDFTFTSPYDNGISRETYFNRCWPVHELIEDVRNIHIDAVGERVFVVYENRNKQGRTFRNCEMMTVRDGKIVAIEVYFGWNLPHPAPTGGFVNP